MGINIEVFSAPGCSKCGRAAERLKKAIADIGDARVQWREVNVLEEIDYAVKLGVLSTPAIVIDGELVFTALPPARKLRAVLKQRLKNG